VRPATATKSIFVESSQLLHHRKNIAVLQEIESKVMPAIIQHAIDLAGITKASIMLELAKKGFARLLTTGERVIDMSNCSRDQLAAVQEIVVKDFKDRGGENVREVRRIKLKLYGSSAPWSRWAARSACSSRRRGPEAAPARPRDHDEAAIGDGGRQAAFCPSVPAALKQNTGPVARAASYPLITLTSTLTFWTQR